MSDSALDQIDDLDAAIYAAVAASSTPSLDRSLRRLSQAANYSRLSLASAAVLSLVGGRSGRRGARRGLVAVGATAAIVNLAIKPLSNRARPDRVAGEVPADRHVEMPGSQSFPSGHAAAAFAFASGTSHVMPAVGPPLRVLATLVGYSRVHTGVHYPSDVVVGALCGVSVAAASNWWLDRRSSTALGV